MSQLSFLLLINVMAWIFVSLQNSCVEIQTLKMIILGSRAFGSWLAHEIGTFMNGISILKKQSLPQATVPVNWQVVNEEMSSCLTMNLLAPLSWTSQPSKLWEIHFYFFFLCLFAISRAIPATYGGTQATGLIGAVAAGLHHSHSSTGSKPCLQPTPQRMAKPDP